jgi:uncharacterized membrane protein
MSTYLASLGLMVSCNVVYSLAQKFLPKDINPFMVLVVVYTIAGSISLGLAFSFRVVSLAEVSSTVGKLNWAVLLLGLAIVGIEFGYLMAFRSGWKISAVALVGNVMASLLLVPLGLMLLKEQIKVPNLIGIALCLIGLVLALSR